MCMSRYFDKNFFNFLIGFLLILIASFSLLIAVGFYEQTANESQVLDTMATTTSAL